MLIDSITLPEGAQLHNATIASGAVFPTDPSVGELFYKTGTSAGLYVYASEWLIVNTGTSSTLDLETLLSVLGFTPLNSAGDTVTGQLVFGSDYKETVVSANSSSAYTVGTAAGTITILTLTANTTLTFPTPTAGKSLTLFVKQDATGARTITWPATVKWPLSTAPSITSTANKLDKFVFTADGASWFGSVAGQSY